MRTTLTHRKVSWVPLTGVLLTLALACERGHSYVGVYLADEQPVPAQGKIFIELKENGVGRWRVVDDEASFRWDVKDNEIRLHTRSGGVLVGRIEEDIMQIALPGGHIRYFKKAKEEQSENITMN